MNDKQRKEIQDIILALKAKNNYLTIKLNDSIEEAKELSEKNARLEMEKQKEEKKNIIFNIIFYVIVAFFIFLEFYIFIL